MAWNNVDEKTFRSMEEAYGKSTTYGGSGAIAVPSSGITNGFVDTRSYATRFSNFEPHEPQYNGNHHLMPALSSPGSATSHLMSSNDGNFIHPSSPPSGFSHRRPSTSSSSVSSFIFYPQYADYSDFVSELLINSLITIYIPCWPAATYPIRILSSYRRATRQFFVERRPTFDLHER